MPAQLICLPDNRKVEVAEYESILEATLKAGIPHVHTCGGKANCSTCRVQVLKGLENTSVRNADECLLAGKLHFPTDLRLAYQTFIKGEVTIRRPVLDQLD
jgi:adenylate cyclase